MINTNETITQNIEFDENTKSYFLRRHELKSFIKSINLQIGNSSSTYFLALYYMDLIFLDDSLDKNFYAYFSPYDYNLRYSRIKNEKPMQYYILVSLTCLISASKFNENDPHVPSLSVFLNICSQNSRGNYIFDLNSLGAAEVIILKTLKYKMQYYTL